ncbi:glyoxylase-like metal-dependent hydrolase (beta-lactamase superfamily II) [Gillisia mitskevichiae]|uniref:Glyoxylase-like metal-dependent hydrolase (Beta-lactamase superfamily II) n=1 Tax=Gillisia mitskevichiae TaxID=270921 RepID=A0A495PYY2_9FLAO|nr:MBL fold metallo-hydrolase [Gillisia mitskevichiae]RKS55783.1 glyoxylase-like metal-dependent hydrolase (beta-lactamase superfamily II) [Gillisia mitskevichiae]
MRKSILLGALSVMISFSAFAFQEMEDVKIEVIPVNDNIYMLVGAGGNIGVSIGEDGVFMIDDQFAPLSEKILASIKTLSEKSVKYLVNTHHHGDHTGGNSNFEKQGTLIFAHENVRRRLKEDEKNTDQSGLPVITFDHKMQLHLNGDDIMAVHVHNAHTDGDALIYFPKSNVLHTGDTFFNGMFPYIDLKSGGSVAGDLEAAKTGLMLINENTKIIPGHGAMASYADYENYLKMLEGIHANVKTAIAEGKSREQIIADESLTNDFITDAAAEKAFINGPKIRGTYYDSLKSEK